MYLIGHIAPRHIPLLLVGYFTTSPNHCSFIRRWGTNMYCPSNQNNKKEHRKPCVCVSLLFEPISSQLVDMHHYRSCDVFRLGIRHVLQPTFYYVVWSISRLCNDALLQTFLYLQHVKNHYINLSRKNKKTVKLHLVIDTYCIFACV